MNGHTNGHTNGSSTNGKHCNGQNGIKSGQLSAEKPTKRQSEFQEDLIKKTFLFTLNLCVTVYTYLTLPLYWFVQKPEKRLQEANLTRASRLNHGNLNSPWMTPFTHSYTSVLDHVSTLDEMVEKMGKYFSLERAALGSRRILREHLVTGPDGKTPLRIDGRTVKQRELSPYQWITYREMIQRRESIARGLHLLGVQQRDKVVILCETCPEFLLFELALAHAGAVQVNVFPTLGNDGIAHAIREVNARFVMTSFELLPKTRAIIEENQLNIEKVIYVPRRVEESSEEEKRQARLLIDDIGGTRFISFDDVQKDGQERGHLVEGQCRPMEKDEVAFIMYTSGTTGVPKGIQATSYQMVKAVYGMLPVLYDNDGKGGNDTYVIYLPQAHIFEATVELMFLAMGSKVGFATSFTLTDTAPGLAPGTPSDLRLLQPTFMIAVPLVLERMRKEIYRKLESRSIISAPLFNYLMEYKIKWTTKGYTTPIVNRLLCSKISEPFGGRLHKLVLGGAQLSPSLQALIKAAVNTKVLQGYGMTETLGACLCMDDEDLSYGRVGRPLRGVYAKLDDWSEGGYRVTDQPRPRGELIIGSRGITLGYFNKPEMNAEQYEDDRQLGVRWVKTGDIAEAYEDGTFAIIDRKKDLIKLANGEYFSLGKIESTLKNCHYVEHICVLGNGLSNYLVALIVPTTNEFKKLAQAYRVPIAKAHTDALLVKIVLKSLREVGYKNNLKKAEIPVKICLISDEWSPDNGLLTAALKMKRTEINARYKTVISQLFEDAE